MNFYQTHCYKLTGSEYKEVKERAEHIFKLNKNKSKRKSYLRSVYFKKEKIFFEYFWIHLNQKGNKIKTERLKFFPCAIELIKKSRNKPTIRINPNNKNEILYRFYGLTKDKEKFCLQIKENTRSNKKHLMSIFPYK